MPLPYEGPVCHSALIEISLIFSFDVRIIVSFQKGGNSEISISCYVVILIIFLCSFHNDTMLVRFVKQSRRH